MNILSLFDGMSCGQIALERAGVKVDNYFASEIDKYAIQVTQHNYPGTIQLGDVTKVNANDLPKIDLLIGGSPCQGFSFAGKQLNFNDPRSKLFFEFVRILNEIRLINPNILFLLENVEMKYEHELVISKYLNVNPITINSTLLSAQNRVRNYWTNINLKPYGLFGDMKPDIPLPKDKHIFLKDILEQEVGDKYYISETALKRVLRRNYSSVKFNPEKTGSLSTRNNSGQMNADSGTTLITAQKSRTIRSSGMGSYDNDHTWDLVVDVNGKPKVNQGKASCITGGGHSGGNHSDMDLICVAMRGRNIADGLTEQKLEPNTNGKTNAITSVQKDNLVKGESTIRRLTEIECERLQTVPDNYTNHVSSTQRYKMLGNGWTVDVVVHILSHLKK